MENYYHKLKSMADALTYQGEFVTNLTLVLNTILQAQREV